MTEKMFEWLNYIGNTVDTNRQNSSHRDFIQMIHNDVTNVRKYKLGDCGESTALTIASLITNGYNNFKVGQLVFDINIRKQGKKEILAKRIYNTTHECVVLNANNTTIEIKQSDNQKNKDAIILDAWAGFCGNTQVAFDKFRMLFMNGNKKISDDNGYEYTYSPRIQLLDLRIKNNKELTQKFAKEYPELIINSSK